MERNKSDALVVAGGRALELEMPGRRTVLKQGGAIAIARPFGVLGAGALMAGAAHAATTVNYSSVTNVDQRDVAGAGGTWQMVTVKCVRSSDGRTDVLVLCKLKSDTTKRTAIRNWYDPSVGRDRVTYFNNYSLRDRVFTGDLQQLNPYESNVWGDWDGGRRLEEVNWSLPGSATAIQLYKDLADYSNNVFIFACRYTYNGVNYVKVEAQRYAGGSWDPTPVMGPFSGSNYSTFFNKYNAVVAKIAAYNSTYGRTRTTMIVGATMFCVGVAGAVLTAGASLTLVASATAGLVSANFAAGNAAIASTEVRQALNDLMVWLEATTGENLVR